MTWLRRNEKIVVLKSGEPTGLDLGSMEMNKLEKAWLKRNMEERGSAEEKE